MKKLLLAAAAMTCMSSMALAEAFPYPDTNDTVRNEKAEHHRHHRDYRDRDGAQNVETYWTCSADNLYVKGFQATSSDRDDAMNAAVAKCEATTVLPCSAIECHQN